MDWQARLADALQQSNDFIDDAACELLNNECNPFNANNIMEAISNQEVLYQNGGIERIVELMEERDLLQLGRMVYDRVITYWEKQAEELAVERYNSSVGDER
jgi:hypothetical protein